MTVALWSFALAVPAAGQATTPKIKLELAGRGSGDDFGYAVAGIGDVTGDGSPEFIVGAPSASPSYFLSSGAVYVYSARTGRLIMSVLGPNDSADAGEAVAGVGDVDGDGVPDFMFGATGGLVEGYGFAGRAFIHSGRTGRLLFDIDGEGELSLLGQAVAGAGDVNGDGLADVVVGAPGLTPPGLEMAGKAYIYSGPVGALELEVPGTQFLGVLGWSVAGAGDIDGDGSADVIIGAPFSGDSGVAYVYSVKTQSLLFQIDGSAIGGLALGMAVAGAGDLDADGTPEVLLGAPWTITNGKVYAYSIAKHTVLFTLTGVSVVEDFGEVVASAGDVDGDGTSDVIVGVPDATPGGKIDAGSVRVYSGKTGAQLFKLDGTKAGDRLGEGVGALGDIDGDGRAEIIVGAPGMDSGVLQDVGTVLVLGL